MRPNHPLSRIAYQVMWDLPGAKTNWDVLPEMQVTVSRRQHVRVGFGVREPFTNTSGRAPQVLFYLLWDRADGKLWNGWR